MSQPPPPPGGGAPQDPYGAQNGPQYGYPQQGYPQQGYPQQGAPYGAPGAPGAYPPGAPYGAPYGPGGYGMAPNGLPYSDKSKITAGLLQLFLGGFGVGRFYTGHTGMALGQLFTCGGLGIWALIDGIILLTGKDATDSEGRVLRG